LIHDIPFSYWFQKTDDPQFRRAFVVVNQSNDQTLNRVLDKSGLLEFVDPQQARLIHSYYNTQIYEIPPR
jgi:non-ribosomal peptide synthetase component E (peptide arylation enzyme)